MNSSEVALYLTGFKKYIISLCKLAQHKKKLSLENIREFMSGLLSGLTHLSRYDIVHRDLKLDNIVLRRMDSFEPVIIDFGLATFST